MHIFGGIQEYLLSYGVGSVPFYAKPFAYPRTQEFYDIIEYALPVLAIPHTVIVIANLCFRGITAVWCLNHNLNMDEERPQKEFR